MKTTPLQFKHFFLTSMFLFTAVTILHAQTPEQIRVQKEEKSAAALAEIEALKEEIKVINRQIQKGMPQRIADSLKHERSVARLKAYKQKVALLGTGKEKKHSSASRVEQEFRVGIPPVITIRKNDTYYSSSLSIGLVVSFGFNTLLTAGERLQDSPYNFIGSRFFELGWAWAKPLQQGKEKIHLKYGLSFMVNGYKLKDNKYFIKENDLVSLVPFSAPLTKSKLTITQLVLPVHLHFGGIEKYAERTGEGWPVELKMRPRNHFQSIQFGLGGYAGINIRNVHKLKYREDGRRKKIKYKDHLNINQFVVGLSGYLSLGRDFYLYSKYELTPIFREQSPKSNHLALGLRMNFD